MKLSVGPLLYYWEREAADRFYEAIAAAPVDIVYLGESVCSKRRTYRTVEWIALAERLRDAGKEVVLTTLALTEAESELAVAARVAGQDGFLVEANDLAVFGRLRSRTIQMLCRRRVQRIVDQCRLAGAGNAGDAGQESDGQFQRDVF